MSAAFLFLLDFVPAVNDAGVFARNTDEGKTWTKPRIVAGPKKPVDGFMASWGYPLVSKSGRIYVLYSRHIGRFDNFPHHTGWLNGICSDDNGATWTPLGQLLRKDGGTPILHPLSSPKPNSTKPPRSFPPRRESSATPRPPTRTRWPRPTL